MAGQSKPGGCKELYYNMLGMVKMKNLSGKVEIIENPSDDRIIQLYQTAKVFVFPSVIEGFGLPVLEAMACGCPVACSNAASLPEVGGDAVLYFNPNDINGMAAAMTRLLDNDSLRLNLAQKGIERAKLFSWEKTAADIYKILSAFC